MGKNIGLGSPLHISGLGSHSKDMIIAVVTVAGHGDNASYTPFRRNFLRQASSQTLVMHDTQGRPEA